MAKAVSAFILSVGLGVWLSFFNQGMGVVVALGVLGSFVIYQNEVKKKQ